MTDEELDSINKKMESNYNSQEKAGECYKMNGTLNFKGSKGEIVDSLSTFKYCNYSNVWYLIRIY